LQWRLPLGLQLAPGVILLTGMLFLPESIRWLALKYVFDISSHHQCVALFLQNMYRGRLEDAKVTLFKLRNRPDDDQETMNEFNQIIDAVTLEKQQDGTVWKELSEPRNIRRVALGCFMQIAQQWTGTNAIVSYFFFFCMIV
jgi:hypothetical protein